VNKPAEKKPPVDAMTFETALAELEDIVSRLEQGEVDLEDSIALYERGTALKAHCEKKLKGAEARLEKIVLAPDGTPKGAEPMDL
jgi:exodeoxyribonuclease VII small subunit